MPVEFRLPDVGEGLREAEIIRWLVAEGARVGEDQPVVEVQTDKATVELPAPAAGSVGKLHAAEGDMVKVGSVILTILTAADEGAAATAATAAAIAGAPAAGPAATTPSAPAVGSIRPAGGRRAPATPSTRHLARGLGIDINMTTGTGPAGRVTDEDVHRAAAMLKDAGNVGAITGAVSHPGPQAAPALPAAAESGTGAPAAAAPHAQAPASTVSGPVGAPATPVAPGAPRADRHIPLRGIRGVIARRMLQSKTTIPHAAVVDEADMGRLAELRQELKAEYPDAKLSYLPFVIKALTRVLLQYPQMNARMQEGGAEVVHRGEIHIGIATATEQGLMVPVIRDADRKSVWELSRAVADLADRCRTGRIRPEELGDGTFTITNIGAIGGLISVPIINAPEVAILGLHKISERPVGRNGEIVLRPMTYLTCAFDHRVIDGDVATRFLAQLIRYLEQPARLLAEMV